MRKTWRHYTATLPWLFFMSTAGYAYDFNGIQINPTASVHEAYDDNVTYVKNNPISDEITHLIGGVDVKQEGKTESFSLSTKIDQELFARNPSFDNTSEYANFMNFTDLMFKQDVTDYDQVKVNDSFSHTEDPTSFQNAFGSISGRYSTYHNVFDLAYHHDLAKQIGLNFHYNNDLLAFTTNSINNSDLNAVGAGAEYDLDSLTILKTDYDYKYRDFYPGSSAAENELTAGVKRYVASHVYVDLTSGADIIASYNGQDTVQPLYRVSLINELDENTQTGISFQKEYDTTGYSQQLFNSWRVSANYAKDFTNRLKGACNLFYGEGDYIDSNTNDKYIGASVGAIYELTRHAKLNLNYTFSKDYSSSPNSGYTKDVVDLGIDYEF